MGGTFDVLHRGHEALLERAFEVGDEEVFVGVTTDRFANEHRERRVRPYDERLGDLVALVRRRGWTARAVVAAIDDRVGRAFDPRYDTIVATEETAKGVEKINAGREERRLPPLRAVLAPIVLAEDGLRLSSTRVRAGEVDAQGRLLGPARVAVGSANAAKIAAVRMLAGRVHNGAEVRGFDVASGVPEQPVGEATWQGAAARAAAALAEWPEAHFGVGIEAGLLESPFGLLDVQACVVLDRGGRLTAGHGPGFPHPPAVHDAVAEGRTVGDAIADLAGVAKVPEEGAIGFLSWGLLSRAQLTEQAVLAAWLPRMRPGLYGIDVVDP